MASATSEDIVNNKALNNLIRNAKKYSKEYNEKYERILLEMICWAMINSIHQHPEVLDFYKKVFVNGYELNKNELNKIRKKLIKNKKKMQNGKKRRKPKRK